MLAAIAGCSTPATEVVDVQEVLNYQQCQQVRPGVSKVTLAELAQIRGSRLLQSPKNSAPINNSSEYAPNNQSLYVAFDGKKPSAGHSLFLARLEQQSRTVEIHIGTTKPSPQELVAQVITSPCVVVEITGLPEGHTLEFYMDGEKLKLNG